MSFGSDVASMDRSVIALLGDDESVVYVASSGASVTVRGVFHDEHALLMDGNVETTGPAVFLRLPDLPSDPDSDDPTLTIRGRSYVPHRRQRDSLGGILLYLHRVS